MNKENLLLYLDLLNLSFPIYYWRFSNTLEQLETNYPLESFRDNLLELLDIKGSASILFETHKELPFIFENQIGLCFLCDYHKKSDTFYLLGPIWNGNDFHTSLHQFELSPLTSSIDEYTLIKELKKYPVLNAPDFMRYAMQLHYVLNQESISSHQVQVLSSNLKDSSKSLQVNYEKHTGIYESEQQFLKLVEEGNLEAVTYMHQLSFHSSGMRLQKEKSIVGAKLNTVVLLTLISRAAIQGGLPPAISYNLNDYYGSAIEEASSISDITKLVTKMIEDYVTRIHAFKENPNISHPIQFACQYIQVHVKEPLSISQIAQEVGYSTYYFSNKFQKEVGMSVNQYILSKRIETAQVLLQNPNLKINDIYTQLCFGSRNHFYTTFKTFTGVSPKEYRKRFGM